MKILYISSLILFFLIFTISLNVNAQSAGKISGKVTDVKSNETLPGATIILEGHPSATATDVEGRFLLANLKPGKYTLSVKYIGYKTKSISDVEVKQGSVTSLDVILDESAASQTLNEIVVKATYRQESVASLYAQQRMNVQISDGISGDMIKRSPDRNTGEVLKRVSGASVQDNKFIVVRGLADRYNTTLMNNAILPSTEPDKKAFSFDIIPSSLIDNIVIYKTATPDLPGDFAGGAVKINTKDLPDSKFTDITVSLGYNSKTTFKNNFIDPTPHGKLDFLGFDDGSRKLPDAYANVKSNYTSGTTSQEKIAIAQQFPNTFAYNQNQTSLPNLNLQFSTGNSKTLKNDNRFGYIFSLNYGTAHRSTTGDRIEYNPSDANALPLYRYDRNNFSQISSLGSVLNLAYLFGKNKIALKNFYNNDYTIKFSQDNNAVNFEGADPLYFKSYSNETTQNGLYTSVLEGQHKLGTRNVIVDWNASYGLSYRNQPDQRIVTTYTPINQPEYVVLSSENSALPNNLGRIYSKLHENIYGANVNLTYPFKFNNEPQKFKLGGLVNYRNRDFSIDALGYVDEAPGSFGNRHINFGNGTTIDNIFSAQSIQQNNIGLARLDQSSTDYKGTSKLGAGYAMLDNKFGSNLHLVWGARLEYFNQVLTPLGKAEQRYNNTDILPSVNLTYNLSEKTNLRLSYFKAVNRPEFRELAAFRYFDYETNYIIDGNTKLQRSTSSNADFRLEYYPSGGEIISISTFYKDFTNPIEQTNRDNSILSFANANSAKDFGAELEVRKKLNFIGGQSLFKNLTFYLNASYINAKVTLPERQVSTPLQGQSPYIINSGLYYTTTDGDLSFNILYNKIGERLKFRGVDNGIDIYEKPRDVIDFQVSKKLMNKRAEIRLTVSDALAQATAFYYNYGSPNNTKFNPKEDKIIQQTFSGFGTTLSFKYNFGSTR